VEQAERSRRFLWGVSLAWIPWVPLLFGLVNAFKGVSEQKATGMGAVLAGLQLFAIFGLVIAVVFGVSAIVLLVRAMSGQGRLRSLFSLLCICMSVLMIFLVGVMLWLWSIQLPYARSAGRPVSEVAAHCNRSKSPEATPVLIRRNYELAVGRIVILFD
jgi:hypothetical protein